MISKLKDKAKGSQRKHPHLLDIELVKKAKKTEEDHTHEYQNAKVIIEDIHLKTKLNM